MRIKIYLSALLLFIGVLVLCYPPVSSYYNKKNGSYAITEFKEKLNTTDQEEIEKQFYLAEKYNYSLKNGNTEFDYDSILNFGNGMMGYIMIPSIEVSLPIFHGTEEEILTKGVGHMRDSAFPIGGEGNHTVLTGHTGLPTAKMFTDLIELKENDYFIIYILNEAIRYKVDQIKVVLPNNTQDLLAVEGKDYCTLVTCTPYGINSHRLLVRGIRVEDAVIESNLQAEEQQKMSVQTLLVFLSAICALVIAVIVSILLINKQQKYRRQKYFS